jgi:hypothetical protein
MRRFRVIDLNILAQSHSVEIAQMLAGIDGAADCALWTLEMRSAVRGGKPLGGPRIKEPFESDDKG